MKYRFVRLLGLAVGSLLACAQIQAATPRVTIDAGKLRGTADGDVVSYKGIPFARPPVGALRWEPPQAPEPWKGARDASEFQLPCYQPTYPDRPNGGGVSGETSEDCLYLNVWAPEKARRAPVMVWFYGGANFLGGGHLAGYDGTAFAHDGVVVVTINYRLGPFGFFAHPAITAAAAKDAPLNNYGNMDQTESLRWVQRNIAKFGGDPGNVTIFGQSAGGAGVYMQLTSPAARGLFHKAIVHSGSFRGRDTPLELAEDRGAAIAEKLGLPGAKATLEQLRAIPADRLSEAMPRGTQPATDGRYMPITPTEAYAFGREADVPFMVGSNSGEGMRGAWDRWAAAQSAGGAPSFQYQFSYVPAPLREKVKGAAHSAEIRYAWNTLDMAAPTPETVSETDRRVARVMHACWVAFANYGGNGPLDCGNGLVWPTYEAASDQLMEFDEKSGVRTHFMKQKWDDTIAGIPVANE